MIGLSLGAAATAGIVAPEPGPGYALKPAEMAAVTDAVRQDLSDPGAARFSAVLARHAPPPSRAINVCGFVEIHDTPGGAAGQYPFMVTLLPPPASRPDPRGLLATVVGVGDPADIGRNYTICKVCDESNLPVCP